MSGAASFKILVSRPSRSRVPDCFKCFRVLYTSVTVNRGITSLLWILRDWQNSWSLSNVLLLVEFLVIIFSATVEKLSFNCSTEILEFTCCFGKDALFVSWCIADHVVFELVFIRYEVLGVFLFSSAFLRIICISQFIRLVMLAMLLEKISKMNCLP